MIKDASAGARWTLAAAVAGSVLLLGATVVSSRLDRPVAPAAAAAPSSPPPPVTASAAPPTPASLAPKPAPSATSAPAAAPPPPSRRGTRRPPAPEPPPARPTTKPPAGPNLSLRADGEADGSTKAQGTSFKDVRDADPGTFWSPVRVPAEISVKWTRPVTVSRITIREAPGGGRIGAWQVRDHDDDELLATGSGAGVITFRRVTLRKITFVVLRSDGTPRVAEYETFAD